MCYPNFGYTPEQVAKLSIKDIVMESVGSRHTANYFFANPELSKHSFVLALVVRKATGEFLTDKCGVKEFNANAIESLMAIFIKSGLFNAYMDGEKAVQEFCSNEYKNHHECYKNWLIMEEDFKSVYYGIMLFNSFYFSHDEFVHIENEQRYEYWVHKHPHLFELAKIYTHYLETGNQKKQEQILNDMGTMLQKELEETAPSLHSMWPSYLTSDNGPTYIDRCDGEIIEKYTYLGKLCDELQHLSNNTAKKNLYRELILPHFKPVEINKNKSYYENHGAAWYNAHIYRHIADILSDEEYNTKLATHWQQTRDKISSVIIQKQKERTPDWLMRLRVNHMLNKEK